MRLGLVRNCTIIKAGASFPTPHSVELELDFPSTPGFYSLQQTQWFHYALFQLEELAFHSVLDACREITQQSERFQSLISNPQPLGYTQLTPSAKEPVIPTFSAKSTADSILEEIQEQYATARDEFEIATEETEKKSVYAEGDRAAAREELDALKKIFEKACEGPDGNEVKSRVGQRIRELDNAVVALEESALED
jgi:hypothetical protein